MRSSFISILAVASVGWASCSNNANTTDADAKDSGTTASSTTATGSNEQPASTNDVSANVPQPARTNFESRYPQANNVKWAHYQPTDMGTTDDWSHGWSGLDTSDYQVDFNWEGTDYMAWYDNGEWVGSSARLTDNSKLPKAVNDAIHQRYSDYTIKEVDKENDKDRTIYEVDLENGKDKLKLHFDENGKVMKAKGKVDGQKVKAKDDTK
jgi:hypothetical protein